MRHALLISLIVLVAAFPAGASAGAGALPRAGTVVATIPADTNLGSLAFGGDSLWLTNADDTLQRIDPTTNAVVATIPLGCCTYHSITYGDGSVWVSNFNDNTVERIDPTRNTVVATIPTLGQAPEGIAVTPDAVWVADHHADTPPAAVDRIDPTTNSVVASIPVGGPYHCCGPQAILAAAGAIWVGVPNLQAVVRIDPASNRVVAQIQQGSSPARLSAAGGLAYAGGHIWSADGGSTPSHLWQIDPSANTATGFVTPGADPGSLAVGFESLWTNVRGELARLDPSTGQVIAELSLPHGATDIAIGAGSVWAATPDGVVRVRPS
jgi:YVTN family beta-propeller protein